MTAFRPLARDDVLPLAKLAVRPDQEHLVAPNAITMAQARFEAGSDVFGIWHGDEAVGLLAIIDFAHPKQILEAGESRDSLYIWRLMVTAGQQRRGHGSAALAFACHMAKEKGHHHVTLTVDQGHGNALGFYEAAGFHLTGTVIEGEAQLLKSL